MLSRFSSILFMIVIHVVFATGHDFAPPEILATNSDVLEPLAGRPVDVSGPVDESRVIRGLLGRRQTGCSAKYFTCGTG